MGNYLSSYIYNYAPMIKRMIIIRGLPNSGKTTLAKQLIDTYKNTHNGKIFSSKDYFITKKNKFNLLFLRHFFIYRILEN